MFGHGREDKGGKRKEKRSKRREEVEEEETDVASVESELSEGKDEVETITAIEGRLLDIVENMTIKRAERRIAALREFNKELRRHYVQEFLASREETVRTYLLNSVRAGESEEVAEACTGLTLVALTLGADAAGRYYRHLSAPLTTLYTDSSKPAADRAAAVELLGVLAFLTADVDALKILDSFVKLFDKEDAVKLVWQSILSWALLASTLSSDVVARAPAKKAMPALLRSLEHKSLEVRSAAGEAVALIYAAHLDADGGESDGDDSEEHGEDGGDEAGEPAWGVDMDEVTAKLEELATDSSHRRAKKDKVKQRSFFRDVLRTVEDGEEPSETLTLDASVKHEFSGWSELVQLNALRHVLAEGLLVHFRNNDLLSEIFGVEWPADEAGTEKMTKEQRQEHFKKSARETEQDKAKQRSKKHAMRHAYED